MTRDEAMARVRTQLVTAYVTQRIKNIVGMVLDGVPSDQVVAAVEFWEDEDLQSLAQVMKNVERKLEELTVDGGIDWSVGEPPSVREPQP